METKIISPGEAWEEVERLKVWVIFNRKDGKWYADVPGEALHFGCGDTAREAVTNLRLRIAEAATKAEVVNA